MLPDTTLTHAILWTLLLPVLAYALWRASSHPYPTTRSPLLFVLAIAATVVVMPLLQEQPPECPPFCKRDVCGIQGEVAVPIVLAWAAARDVVRRRRGRV